MQWMQHFMAGFFLVFSFFKLLNLKGFAESYLMYDVLARRIPIWAYAYAFVELGLAIAYTINFNPFITNLTTLIVMSISIIGVLQSVLNKKKIQCACLVRQLFGEYVLCMVYKLKFLNQHHLFF